MSSDALSCDRRRSRIGVRTTILVTRPTPCAARRMRRGTGSQRPCGRARDRG
jgi:hypothetical protein